MAMRPIQRSEQRTPQRVRPMIRTSLNRYQLDDRRIPSGMTYEWKRKSVLGQEDVESQINYEFNGWTAVPPERHPELMGSRATAAQEIVRGGLVLMERPREVTDEARDLDEFAARNQVAAQMQRLKLEGKRSAGKGIRTSYEAAPEDRQVPEDE